MNNTVFPDSRSIVVDSTPQPEALRVAILNQARTNKNTYTIAVAQSEATTGANNGKINGEQCGVDDDSS